MPRDTKSKKQFRGGVMSDLFLRVVGGRLFGLNVGDWSMLLGGVALVGLLALLI